MEEYEYNFKVKSLEPVFMYLKENNYKEIFNKKQNRIVYENIKNRNIISRITSNDEDYLFDFKNKSYETETLKISKESLPLKIKKKILKMLNLF